MTESKDFHCLALRPHQDGQSAVCDGQTFTPVFRLPAMPVSGLKVETLYACTTCAAVYRAVYPTGVEGDRVPRARWVLQTGV